MPLDSPSESDQPASVDIGRAIRRLRAKKATQEAIADLLGVTQGTVSQWETGRSHPSFRQMQTIERHLGLGRGSILVAAGLVEVGGIEAAILADDSLDENELDLLLRVYRSVAVKGTGSGKRRKG